MNTTEICKFPMDADLFTGFSRHSRSKRIKNNRGTLKFIYEAKYNTNAQSEVECE
jgi:hypothetical protein